MTFPYDNHDLTAHPPDKGEDWGSTHPIFRALITQVQPKIIFEIGTWKGASAIHMGRICRELGLRTKIYCIDTWLGSLEHHLKAEWQESLRTKNGYPQIYYTFLSNVIVNGLTETIIPIPMPESIAIKYLTVRPDFIYLDGSHDQTDTERAIMSYWPTLNLNGVMLIDDWNDESWPGVTAAVKWAFNPININSKDHKAWIFKHQPPPITKGVNNDG